MNKTREIKHVLATVPYTGWHIEELRKACMPALLVQVDRDDSTRIAEELEKADVAILAADLDLRYVEAPNMKWIHCDHSGLNNSAIPAVFERDGLIVTGSAGRSIPVLAEHALYFALSLTYKAKTLHEAQKQHLWNSVNNYRDQKGMFSKTMGIIGLGNTGMELAKRAKVFGMRTLGYTRSIKEPNENFDKLFCFDKGDVIDELIAESDYIVLTCRLSDETYHLIGEKQFNMMKKTAYLINMSRGAVVDEKALSDALYSGRISGAGLDVFETEPLPQESPLWEAPNLYITPHCTPEVPDLWASSLRIIIENIHRYRNGEEMLNKLTLRDVYHQKN